MGAGLTGRFVDEETQVAQECSKMLASLAIKAWRTKPSEPPQAHGVCQGGPRGQAERGVTWLGSSHAPKVVTPRRDRFSAWESRRRVLVVLIFLPFSKPISSQLRPALCCWGRLCRPGPLGLATPVGLGQWDVLSGGHGTAGDQASHPPNMPLAWHHVSGRATAPATSS